MAAADMGFAPSPTPSSDNKHCTLVPLGGVKTFVIVVIPAMFLLHVLGSLRRLVSHGLLHAIVMGVYTLSYPLVSYTIGWMRSANCSIYDFAVWAVCLLLLLGSTDSLTALRVDEVNNWKSIYVKHLMKAVFVVYIVMDIVQEPKIKYLRWPLMALLMVGVLRWYVRIASMRMVSRPYLRKNVKVIDGYMKKHNCGDKEPEEPFNPVTMEGCWLMVAGEKYYGVKQARDKVTTVEKIWQCKGKLLLRKRGKVLKDVCLSMALSKLLNQRFAGFKVSEAELAITRDLVFNGLLVAGGGDDDKPHQRVFRVIEEELVFIHGLYYTRYSYLQQKGRFLALCLPVVMFALCSRLTYVLVRNKKNHLDFTVYTTVILAFLEAYQLYLYIASGWFKVVLIQSYVSTPCLQGSGCCLVEMIIGFLLRLKEFRPWKNRLGQYCVLREFCRRKSRVKNFLHYATLRLVDKPGKMGRHGSVKLSENVKEAIIGCLQGNNGNLTNGVASLQNNGVHDRLALACDGDAIATDGTVARTILVWHIATTMCREKLDAQAQEDDVVKTASTLSQYCMYLLAFAPNLLPEKELILDESIDEADEILKGAKTLKERCDKLEEISTNDDGDGGEAPPIVQGARLARHLIKDIEESALRWKVLCDFWVEMLLYVSPADNARAHLDALAKGGEFITHVWALLAHAGVLRRGPLGPTDVV